MPHRTFGGRFSGGRKRVNLPGADIKRRIVAKRGTRKVNLPGNISRRIRIGTPTTKRR